MRDPRYDILFEPVRIGPVTAKNRFYQVPHCNGGGYRDPSAAAEMRRIKSEGGSGVIFTEQTELHHTSEITPFIELRLWDDADVPMLHRMADAMHQHGALPASSSPIPASTALISIPRRCRAAPSRPADPHLHQRSGPGPRHGPDDIRDLRRWHRNAFGAPEGGSISSASMARMGSASSSISCRGRPISAPTNMAASLANRSRFMHESVADAKDAIGDSCGITLRLSLDEMIGTFGLRQCRRCATSSRCMPSFPTSGTWRMAAWEDCSGPSRFKEEAAQEDLVAGIKELTTKPVVGVGRFTSPDVMVRLVRPGVLDFIGCARPSIADPFLPRKIEEGRIEDIRECIGCNICITGDMTMSITRCTQNPTFMEEWRKGWHPERIQAKGASAERARSSAPARPGSRRRARLGQRGYKVALAEAGTELGGRVAREWKLPGLSAWGRVRDYRAYQLAQLAECRDLFRQPARRPTRSWRSASRMSRSRPARPGGATAWRAPMSCRCRSTRALPLFTPDDLMDGQAALGRDRRSSMTTIITWAAFSPSCWQAAALG